MTDKKVVVQRGLWFEEFETGVLYQHRPGRTITEADNVLFTTLTMNTQALHLDAAFSDALPPFNLYAETEITDKRESKSRPGEGIVTFAHTGRNQHGDVVATASRKTMVRKRPEGDA